MDTPKYPKLIRSSENSNNLSLTLKGATILALIYLAKQAGFDISSSDAMVAVETLIVIGTALMTLYGIVRKVMNADRIDKK